MLQHMKKVGKLTFELAKANGSSPPDPNALHQFRAGLQALQGDATLPAPVIAYVRAVRELVMGASMLPSKTGGGAASALGYAEHTMEQFKAFVDKKSSLSKTAREARNPILRKIAAAKLKKINVESGGAYASQRALKLVQKRDREARHAINAEIEAELQTLPGYAAVQLAIDPLLLADPTGGTTEIHTEAMVNIAKALAPKSFGA